MIALWVREIVGWILVALSLAFAWSATLYLSNRQVVEAGVVAFLSLGMLRAGIALTRIATAGRILGRKRNE